jgi:hypothetical protein
MARHYSNHDFVLVVIFEIQEIGTIGGYVSDISSRDVLETIRPQCVKLLEASNSDNTWLPYVANS